VSTAARPLACPLAPDARPAGGRAARSRPVSPAPGRAPRLPARVSVCLPAPFPLR